MLNIIIVTQDDPFYVPIFFEELFKKNISQDFNFKGIIIQPPLGKKSLKKLCIQMFDFYGLIGFIIMGIKFVIFKLLNYAAINLFNGKFPGGFSVEHIIRKNHINIIKIKNINSSVSLNYLKSLNIDVIFSIAASQIFRENILALPPLGCFNIHTSKLPKNRGMMPNFWSLFKYYEDPTSAVTIHRMNENLDDGDILIQTEFYLDPEESLDSLIKRTKKMSADTFLKAINILSSRSVNLIKNDSSKASYNTFPKKEDVLRFRKRGFKIR